jgi:hypothetical protein
MHLISSPSKPAGESADVGDEQPSDSTGDSCFEVLGEPAAATEPSERALDYPSARQHSRWSIVQI